MLQTPEWFHSTRKFAGYRFAFVGEAMRVRRAELQVDKVEVGQKNLHSSVGGPDLGDVWSDL